MAQDYLVLVFFETEDLAKLAVDELKKWDKAEQDIDLGAIGILMKDKDGKIKTLGVGDRAGGKGARTGIILGVIAAILSGGVTLLGGVVAGALGGGVLGSLFHSKLGLSKEQLDAIRVGLDRGQVAVGVMSYQGQVPFVSARLKELGGRAESYELPGEVVEQATKAEAEGVSLPEPG